MERQGVRSATLDGHLVARSMRVWPRTVEGRHLIDRAQRSYSITGPPQAAGSVVVIGNSGAEFGVRGYITAYDLDPARSAGASSRCRAIRAKSAPEHPEMAAALTTWSKTIGLALASAAVVGEMNLRPRARPAVYGHGHPAAGCQAAPGRRDNLYLASILAIKPGTGKLAWYFQTTPGEMRTTPPRRT